MPKLGFCKCCFGQVSSEANACPHCGQPDLYSDSIEDRIRGVARDKGKIHAIKLLREETGWGLREAKDYVDSLV